MSLNTRTKVCETTGNYSVFLICNENTLNLEEQPNMQSQVYAHPMKLKNINTSNSDSTKDVTNQRKQDAPDGGWGWTILVAAFFCTSINFGILDSYGLLYTMLMEKFPVTIAELSWIGSLQIGTAGIGGFIAPLLLDRIGCRLSSLLAAVVMSGGLLLSMLVDSSVYVLYLTLGAMPGFAFFLQLLSIQTILCSYFNRYQPLVFGIMYSSAGVGNIVIAPFLTSLYSTFGLRGTFLLMGGVTLNQVCCVLTFRPFPRSSNKATVPMKPVQHKPYLQLLKKRKMWLFIFNSLSANMVAFYYTSFVPGAAKAQISGLTLEQTSLIISTYGLANIISRIITGIVCTVLRPRISPVFATAVCACGILIAAVPFCTSYGQMLSVSVMYAFAYGCYCCTFPSVVLELFEPRFFTYACGLYYLVAGFSCLLGLPFGGFIITLTSNYDTVFFIAAAVFVFSVLFLMPLVLPGICSRRIRNSNTIVTRGHI